jgi:hypothetical protein
MDSIPQGCDALAAAMVVAVKRFISVKPPRIPLWAHQAAIATLLASSDVRFTLSAIRTQMNLCLQSLVLQCFDDLNLDADEDRRSLFRVCSMAVRLKCGISGGKDAEHIAKLTRSDLSNRELRTLLCVWACLGLSVHEKSKCGSFQVTSFSVFFVPSFHIRRCVQCPQRRY